VRVWRLLPVARERLGVGGGRGLAADPRAHPTRVALVVALREADQPLSAADLEPIIGKSRANLVYHLRTLATMGICETVRASVVDGRTERFFALATN
jgi:DNA-binding transcriptional ArsR family regulator